MSRDWNEKELQMASNEMKKMGYMSYDEFCEYLKTHPMTGITKNLSRAEKYFIKWLDENGFDGKVIKQYQSKTVFQVSKDGIEDTVNIPNVYEKDFNVEVFCSNYLKQFETLKELHDLGNLRHGIKYRRRNRQIYELRTVGYRHYERL